jgi:hypothetical protein
MILSKLGDDDIVSSKGDGILVFKIEDGEKAKIEDGRKG